MSTKILKLICLIFLINLFTKITANIPVDKIDISIDDNLKGQVEEQVIRDSIKLEYINSENTNNTQTNSSTENKKEESKKKTEETHKEGSEEKSQPNSSIFDEIKGAYRIRSQQELNYLLELSDLTFLKFTYLRHSKNSISVARHVKSIAEKLNHLAGIIMIDCEIFSPEHYDDCQIYDYLQDSFPKLKLLVPPEKRYDINLESWETHFEFPWTEKEMTESTIYNFIIANIPNKASKIDENTSYGFFNLNSMNKVVLFTDKNSPTLLFKGLSNYFFDRIAFGIVKKDQEELIKKFSIKKFPTLMIYKNIDRVRFLDEPELLYYAGLPKAENLVEFIEPHCLSEKFHYRQRRGIMEHDLKEMTNKMKFTEMNKKNYEHIFEKLGDKNVVVYFDKKFRMKNSFKQFFVKNYGFFNTFYFDCSQAKKFCLDKFSVEKFPSLKLFKTNTTNVEEKIKTFVNLPYANNEANNLNSFLKSTFEYKVNNLTNIEFSYFMTEAKFNKKYVIGYFSDNPEEDITDSLSLLSSDKNLQENFEFVYLKNPESDNRKKYKIFNLPSIYLFFLRKDEYKTISLPVSVLFETLKSIAYSLQYYKNQKLVVKNYYSELIPQIEDNSALKKNCLDYNECVLFLFDAKDKEQKIEEFDFMMRKLENVRSKPFLEKIKFNWVNVTCHKDLLERLEVNPDKVPGIIFLFPWRTAYALYNNYFEDFPLTEFFEKSTQGRTETKYIKREGIYLSNKNCEDPEDVVDDSEGESVELKADVSNDTKSVENEINLDEEQNNNKDEEKKKGDL